MENELSDLQRTKKTQTWVTALIGVSLTPACFIYHVHCRNTSRHVAIRRIPVQRHRATINRSLLSLSRPREASRTRDPCECTFIIFNILTELNRTDDEVYNADFVLFSGELQNAARKMAKRLDVDYSGFRKHV